MKLKALGAVGLVLATLVSVLPTVASADESSMINLHEWRLEGRKTCFVGHFHSGNTNGTKRSKKRAMRDAIVSWQEFTAAEYGTDWAYFKYAANKAAKCNRSSAGWSCYVEGRPCNPKRRRRR